MGIFVDPLMRTQPSKVWPYTQACHLITDGNIDELHAFAKSLGLKREWFQGHHVNPVMHHYDCTSNKRQQALAQGAKEITRAAFSQMVFAASRKLKEDATIASMSAASLEELNMTPEQAVRMDVLRLRKVSKKIKKQHIGWMQCVTVTKEGINDG